MIAFISHELSVSVFVSNCESGAKAILSPVETVMIPSMERITAGGKPVYIVHSHNQVLEAWETCPGLNVFSLDFHTDTREAFGNYAYWRADSDVKAGRCEDRELRKKELADQKIKAYLDGSASISSINDNLKHDEHIDFAVRTDMIGRAFVLATNRNRSSSNPHVYLADDRSQYEGQRIIEYSPPCVPACLKDVHDDECVRLRADSVIEDHFLGDALSEAESFHPDFFDTYILDMDCDSFNTEKSLHPENLQIFRRLIRKAALVTIALEPECVRICRMEGCLLDSRKILDGLMAIIKTA